MINYLDHFLLVIDCPEISVTNRIDFNLTIVNDVVFIPDEKAGKIKNWARVYWDTFEVLKVWEGEIFVTINREIYFYYLVNS